MWIGVQDWIIALQSNIWSGVQFGVHNSSLRNIWLDRSGLKFFCGIECGLVEVKKVRNRILPPQQLHSRQGTLTHIPTNDLHSSAIRTHRHTCYRWTDRPSVPVCTACKRTERWSRDNNRPKGFSLVTTDN